MASDRARVFGQDMTKGEGAIPTDGLGPGKRRKGKFAHDTEQTNDLRGGLTHRTSADPYRSKRANAMPSGGGGGGWKDMNEKLAKSRARLRQTASLKGGLTVGTTIHPYDGTDPETEASASGTSIFDPTLCELAYKWFCPKGGTVLDPFAGGSVRGIIASRLGLKYYGVELRPEQVAANKAQLKLANGHKPVWKQGDARELESLCKGVQADLIFSCPPYWNLERYSDDPADLSTLDDAEEFCTALGDIIFHAVSLLKEDRFIVWVTSDVRDKQGYYANIPGRTVAAFEAAGARLYNDAVLVTAAGSLPVRVKAQFVGGRKLGRTHQYVQIYCKGNWKKAVAELPPPEFGEIDSIVGPAAEFTLDIGGEV